MKITTKNRIKRTVAVSLYGLCIASSLFFIENATQCATSFHDVNTVDVVEAIAGGALAGGSLLGIGYMFPNKLKEDNIENNENDKTL